MKYLLIIESLTEFYTLTHTHTLTHSHIHTLTHSHTHTLAHTYTLTHAHTHTIYIYIYNGFCSTIYEAVAIKLYKLNCDK